MAVSKVPFVTFNNGFKYPIFGLGTWKSEPGKVKQAVKDAIDIGYNHIDCAYVYQNEREIGDAIGEKISEGLKREDIYITGKLWNTFHRPDLVLGALQKTLSDLKLEYIDLYLMHWPMAYKECAGDFPKDENDKTLYSDVPFTDTWKELEKCVSAGLVKSIGVSNFNSKQIEEILKIATIKPVVNQVECHPFLNQEKLKEFCESRGILLEAYSPLGSGDRPWAKSDSSPILLQDDGLIQLANKYNKTPAQILLKYQVQRGVIAIAKSINKNRLIENIDIWEFLISDDDIKLMNSWDRNIRYCHLSWASDHKYYPFHEKF